ncbi:hypothetical protein NQZ68_002719 [Dissostichus eleginoides]|nr:hypothetical protein NQZ68_002719 [Dissostichus eleginoides]
MAGEVSFGFFGGAVLWHGCYRSDLVPPASWDDVCTGAAYPSVGPRSAIADTGRRFFPNRQCSSTAGFGWTRFPQAWD